MSSDAAKLLHAAGVGNDAKVKRLLKAKVDVNPFHVDDEGWYDSDEDPFELLKMVAGNKRAIIMPKGYEDPDEDAMET